MELEPTIQFSILFIYIHCLVKLFSVKGKYPVWKSLIPSITCYMTMTWVKLYCLCIVMPLSTDFLLIFCYFGNIRESCVFVNFNLWYKHNVTHTLIPDFLVGLHDYLKNLSLQYWNSQYWGQNEGNSITEEIAIHRGVKKGLQLRQSHSKSNLFEWQHFFISEPVF